MAALVARKSVNLGRQRIPAVIGSVYIFKRDASDLTAYKRGRGGRSSFSGHVVTVFGSSGFIGRNVVNQLGKIGSQVICPYRGDPYFSKDLKLAGDLGQILFLPFHLQDEESLHKVMKYSNTVINLIGADTDTKCFTCEDVNDTGARAIARIARECGVKKLIHFSHLNASPKPQQIYMKGGSRYLKSKYAGELAVREEFPDATIFKPSTMYGQNDRFLEYYGDQWRRHFGTVPLWKRGTETVKMPVYVADVAKGVANALNDLSAPGQDYDCVGPERFLLSELVDFFFRCMRRENPRSYMTPLFKAKVRLLSSIPKIRISTLMSMEKLEIEHISDEYRGNPTLEDLDVKLSRIADRAPYDMLIHRINLYYEESVGEFAPPAPPVALA